MALMLRFTAPLSTDYRDWLHYTIVEDGRRDACTRTGTAAPSCDGFSLHDLLRSEARYHQPERGQGAIPTQLAEVPHGLDSCTSPLYLNVEFAFAYCRPKGPVVGPSRS
jgi:hypothetical protein